MSESLPVIVTRPEPGNAATVARAKARDLAVHGVPLFAANPVAWQAPGARDFDALLLTSAQAVRLAGPDLAKLASLPVHAVGAATTAAAEAAGLRVVQTGPGDAQQLIDAMTSPEKPRILWLCGHHRSVFDARGASLVPLACYRVDPVEPSSLWDDLTAAPAVILAHSVRAATRIAALTEERRRHLSLVAISPAAAAAAGAGWAVVTVTSTPDDAAMVTAAHALCQKDEK